MVGFYLDKGTDSALTSSFVNVNALRFGNDGWNFKNDELAIASCTNPSCHKNAAKTARKLSAKPAGSARFGYTLQSADIVFSFSSFSKASCLSALRCFWHVDDFSPLLCSDLTGDAQSWASIETVIVRFICLRGDCGSKRISFPLNCGSLSN